MQPSFYTYKSGEETSRWLAVIGVIPGGKLLTNSCKGLKKLCEASSTLANFSKVTTRVSGSSQKNLSVVGNKTVQHYNPSY
jgi:hypothetical protein